MKRKSKIWNKVKNFIVVFLVFAMLITSISAFIVLSEDNYKKSKYYTFDDVSFSEQEYSTFYSLYLNEFVNEYGMYLSYWGLDVNKDFSKQQYDEEHTWEDALLINMENDLEQFIVLNKDLKKSKEKVNVKDSVDALIEIFKSNAQTAGTDYEQYLQDVFGAGVTEKDVRKVVEYKYKAIEYSNVLYKKFFDESTEKDLIALYTDYPATFDKITYRMVTFDKGEEADAINFESVITNEDSFISLAKKYTTEDTLKTDVATQDIDVDDIAAWLYDESREPGDKTIIKTESNDYVVYFKSRKLCEDRTANFKHIYFNTIGAISEERSAIKSKADAVYSAIINSSNPVEEFDKGVMIYSDDSTTKLKGGSIENVREGQIDKELDEWLFDSNRKQNDMVLKETSSGFYIFCFENFGEIYWKVFARQYLAEQKYNEYLNDLMSNTKEYKERAEQEAQNANTSETQIEDNSQTATEETSSVESQIDDVTSETSLEPDTSK